MPAAVSSQSESNATESSDSVLRLGAFDTLPPRVLDRHALFLFWKIRVGKWGGGCEPIAVHLEIPCRPEFRPVLLPIRPLCQRSLQAWSLFAKVGSPGGFEDHAPCQAKAESPAKAENLVRLSSVARPPGRIAGNGAW